jgi:spermidine synthase
VPAYDSPWGFVYGTKGPDPKELGAGSIREGVGRRGLRLRYYDERVHGAMFALPRELLEEMGGGSLVATDADPTFMPI